MRDGNRSDSVETPVAIEECLALGLAGVRGIVADSKAYSRRTLGLCLEHGIGLVTLVPRTCAVRQELEAWGGQQPALPLLLEKPGRTQDEEPRRWHGQSVLRQVEVEYKEGRIAQATLRFVVVHSSQLAHQHAQTYASGQAKEAEAVTDHVQRVQARWFACAADAEAAIVEYEGRGLGRRGRRPRPWRYHAVHYRVVADTRPTRRARRGRPAKTDPPSTEAGYRLVVEVAALDKAEEDNGWTVLATTVSAEVCTDAEILQAYQEQHTTVEPGFRWMHKAPCGRTRRGDRQGPSPPSPIRANCLNLKQKKCKFLLCCRCCQASFAHFFLCSLLFLRAVPQREILGFPRCLLVLV